MPHKSSGTPTPSDRTRFEDSEAVRRNLPCIAHALMGIQLAEQIQNGGPSFLLPSATDWCYRIARRAIRMSEPGECVRVAHETVLAIELDREGLTPQEDAVLRLGLSVYETRMGAEVRP